MSWYKTIKEIEIGHPVESKKNGKGMVTGKTQRTVTVLFENGTEVKNTYKHADAPFWQSEF